jgi:hypothetical protein
MNKIPFYVTDWDTVQKTVIKGEKGISYWRTIVLNGLRLRIVEYSENFIADHWCEKGHILYCLNGELTIKLSDNSQYIIGEGMSFVVSDNTDSHLVFSEKGAKVFIIDGDFLK